LLTPTKRSKDSGYGSIRIINDSGHLTEEELDSNEKNLKY